MNLIKKVNKEEANHKHQSQLKIKTKKRKNQVQEANPKLKNQKFNLRWNIEEKSKKMHQK